MLLRGRFCLRCRPLQQSTGHPEMKLRDVALAMPTTCDPSSDYRNSTYRNTKKGQKTTEKSRKCKKLKTLDRSQESNSEPNQTAYRIRSPPELRNGFPGHPRLLCPRCRKPWSNSQCREAALLRVTTGRISSCVCKTGYGHYDELGCLAHWQTGHLSSRHHPVMDQSTDDKSQQQ